MQLTDKWLKALNIIDFAFQPIVSIDTGEVMAYEALLRNYQDAGFEQIGDFFDLAYEEGVLFSLDTRLREKCLRKFQPLCEEGNVRLFYNIDNRVIEMPNYESGKTIEVLKRMGLPMGCLTFEISEKHQFSNYADVKKAIDIYRGQGFKMALDDFGIGYSGLELLYRADPDFVKIDRFFITDIDKDPKKYLMLSMIINIAKVMGFQVIAEGVETEAEFHVCKSIGCNYIQGYYIAHPTTDLALLEKVYALPPEGEDEVIHEKTLRIVHKIDRLCSLYEEIDNIERIVFYDKSNQPVGLYNASSVT